MAEAVEVFFSYSHADEPLRDELAKHLTILERLGIIHSWHDRRILPGEEWDGQINKNLDTAQVILLLISSDFLASRYCWDVEVKQAMARHEAKTARVIPVILREVDWRGAPFGKLQALPTNARAVTSFTNRDEAFKDVAQGIRAAVEQLQQAKTAAPPGSAHRPGHQQLVSKLKHHSPPPKFRNTSKNSPTF
ncbi:MAG: toll/interleukin-1 receptor domain-containing protein [Leptolyngbyaceae cyanobacterium SM2_3_12]|nr:toll/interleukin-1 receptor domain-containing protein [Leptolyngbyaceae cyanobacterium SM2_3_12]